MMFTLNDASMMSRAAHETASDAEIPIPLPSNWYVWWKPIVEFTAALLLSAFALPVVLVVALVVKLTSRGPAFYSQTRVGKDGRLFLLFKIRSMAHNCEKASGAQWSKPGDPRITRVGAFLRKTHLDELPQLLNVLKGDMSLVGPRPERPEFIPALEQAIPHYRDRLAVRPGVTGLAQVQLPPDTDISSVGRKLACDLYYIRTLNWWLDFRLIACTAVRMAGVPYHIITRAFLLPNQAQAERAYQIRTEASETLPELAHASW
jgi:lipopolysaccharide/colanic/teichoic acid biosynthesis glycosyltransferase